MLIALTLSPLKWILLYGVVHHSTQWRAKSSRAFQLLQKWPYLIFLEIVKAAAGLDTALPATRRMSLSALSIALATGKNTRLFGVLDQNETRFFTYVSQLAESMAATVAMRD